MKSYIGLYYRPLLANPGSRWMAFGLRRAKVLG